MNKDITMLILSSGKSSRMGTLKQNLMFKNDTFLNTLVQKGKQLEFFEILISGNSKCDDCRNINDIYTDIGPLGGIHSGLKAMKTQCMFVISVDLPQIPMEIIKKLTEEHLKDENRYVTFLKCDEFREPLISVWNKNCIKNIEQSVENKCYSVLKSVQKLPINEYIYLGEKYLIQGVNTPEEYADLKEKFSI